MEGGGSGGVRLHVGGLGESVGRDDLLKIFSPMGSVEAVEFVRTKGRSFAYIDFSPASENSLTKLFSTYNGCKWKGGKLRLEKAKEHYMARLKREWAEAASVPTDETVKAPEKSAPSTHLNIFFPRLRKVKAMPLSGTGKHKYSFQRVAVPSLLPKTFCDCEEHSASLTPRETHARDLEAINVGINEEEVNIMNSVMNKLLKRDGSIIINEKDDSIVSENDEIIVDTKDNIVINVVSNGKDMMDTELDILSRKRKSMLDQTPCGGDEGAKGKPIHPNKKRQSIIPEGSGRQEASLAIREKKKPSEVDPDEPSRTTGVKRSTDSISWSQKSSWKALVANGSSSNFSVSSFLPDFSSSKAVQPASDTDVEGSEHSESEDSDVEGSDHSEPEDTDVEGSEPEESDVEGSEHSEPDDNDVEGSEHSEPEDADVVGSDHSEPEDADVEGSDLSEPEDAEGSDHSEPEDTDLVGSDHSEPEDTVVADISVDAETVELAASTEGDGEDRSLNVEKDENLAEDSDAEKESSEDSVDHDVDEEETERGELEGCKKSAGGSLWLQKASWTQLVKDQNASFSITQLFPGSASDKSEAVSVSDNGDGQFSNSNQSGTGMKQRDDSYSTNRVGAAGVHGASSSTALRSSKENEQIVKAKNASGGSRLGARKPIRREIGSGETCAFMRSETSVNEWKRAKKALGEPGRKKKSEE